MYRYLECQVFRSIRNYFAAFFRVFAGDARHTRGPIQGLQSWSFHFGRKKNAERGLRLAPAFAWIFMARYESASLTSVFVQSPLHVMNLDRVFLVPSNLEMLWRAKEKTHSTMWRTFAWRSPYALASFTTARKPNDSRDFDLIVAFN